MIAVNYDLLHHCGPCQLLAATSMGAAAAAAALVRLWSTGLALQLFSLLTFPEVPILSSNVVIIYVFLIF